MEEVMNTKDKLNLMKQIDEDNRKHLEEFIQAHMKIWVADYVYIDRDGNKIDIAPGSFRSPSLQVEALNIRDALEAAEKKLKEMREECGWLEFIITDVGICNANVW